ncbi:MAG: hypothetical protein R3E79_37920 [Caldilineaceae bacterium]
MSMPRMLTDREALEHLREMHPELRPLRAIADLPEATFVTRYAPTAFRAISAWPAVSTRRLSRCSNRRRCSGPTSKMQPPPGLPEPSLTTSPRPFSNTKRPSPAMTGSLAI